MLGAGGMVYATANNGSVIAADQQNLDVLWSKALPNSFGSNPEVLASPTLDCNRDKPSSGTGVRCHRSRAGIARKPTRIAARRTTGVATTARSRLTRYAVKSGTKTTNRAATGAISAAETLTAYSRTSRAQRQRRD